MRVVIVGAGLSGLSLATFLRRLNVDCVVVEQAPFLHANYVAPYTLFANALSCFKAFGVEHIFTSSGMQPEGCFGIQGERGNWLLKISNKNVRLPALGAEDVVPLSTAPPANSESIVSQRLSERRKEEMGYVPLRCTIPAPYLREALRRHIPELKLSAKVVDLLPHNGAKGGVHVVLQDGSTEWGDVVVGADGMHSTIRHLLYPSEHVGTSSSSLGMVQIDGLTHCHPCPPHLVQPVECWGTGRILQAVPLHRFGEDTLAFSATLHSLPQELVSLRQEMDPMEVLHVLQRLLGREYASFGDQVATLLSQASLAVPTEVLEVPVMPRWYNRRAVLIGEAAHGSLPSFLNQDASLCVEDAALLAVALLDVPLQRDSGFEYAFRQYETVRRDRIERYIRQSRRARKLTAMRNATLRNTLLRLSAPFTVTLAQRWLSKWTYSSQQLEVDPKTKMETAFR
ncbi:hypothetical protein LSCM1_04277 [Leishmania martiniquensis]|uniref:FAD-binding domain-containing protein n=1 Tax=Leishmania martiniquensis TaxID=1580590 RepID=A0A836G7A5_9TRYP|nr:hypothetical protein LSCM1_04277 [Leishmania martiniquensis]